MAESFQSTTGRILALVFEGLDDVAWAEGTEEVPDLLHAIADGSSGLDPLWGLEDLLATHESIAPNMRPTLATAVLPYLLDVAEPADTSIRQLLVQTIGELWESDLALSIDHVDPAWSTAWSHQLPRLVEFLEDPDVTVRRRTLLALSETTDPPDVARVLAALRSHWDREPDRLTKIDLALAIGRLETLDAADPVDAWLRGLLDQADAEARLGAAAVLTKRDPEYAPAELALADAVRSGDLPPWERDSWLVDERRSAADWVTGAPGRLERQVTQCLERLDDPDDESRVRAVREAALLLASWRSPQAVLLPAVAARLGDGAGEARAYAIHVLAACGPASAPFADRVAELMADDSPASELSDQTIGDLAVWALARMGDHRCVDELRDQVRGSRAGFSVWSSTGGHPQFYMLDMPAMHQVLGPLRELIPDLLPAVRERLRTSDDYQWHREMAETLAVWGPDAAAAVPELIELLSLDAAGWAAHALGEMGPSAEPAVAALRRFARGPTWTDRLRSGRPADSPRGRLSLPSEDSRPRLEDDNRMQAAWAYARVTGETDLAVRVLARGLDGDSARPAIRLLASLGPLDDANVDDRLLAKVNDLIREGDRWDRIDAAQVHWRLTGDASVAVDRMVETLRPLERAFFERQMRLAVDYVGELGPLASDAAPALRALLELDRRLGPAGSWQSIEEDTAIRHRAETALARVTAG